MLINSLNPIKLFKLEAIKIEPFLIILGFSNLGICLLLLFVNYYYVNLDSIIKYYIYNILYILISISYLFYTKLKFNSGVKAIYLFFSIIYQLVYIFILTIHNSFFVAQWLLFLNILIIVTSFSFIVSILVIILSLLCIYLWLVVYCSLAVGVNMFGLIISCIGIIIFVSYKYYYNGYIYNTEILYLKKENQKVVDELHSKTALLNNVGHEIRNPLHGLLGITKILHSKPNISTKEYNIQIKIIYETINYLAEFTNDLLDYTKFNAGKMKFNFEQIDLVIVIEENINLCTKLYLNDINMKIVFNKNNESKAYIWADRSKIHQLLNNLLVNAIKYSEEGIITVTLQRIMKEESEYWELSVLDQGKGILESDLKIIFDPFVRGSFTAKNFSGTGLGLSFCKEIVQAHEGLIWAENNIGTQGAVFIVMLPIYKNKLAIENII